MRFDGLALHPAGPVLHPARPALHPGGRERRIRKEPVIFVTGPKDQLGNRGLYRLFGSRGGKGAGTGMESFGVFPALKCGASSFWLEKGQAGGADPAGKKAAEPVGAAGFRPRAGRGGVCGALGLFQRLQPVLVRFI